MSKKAYSPTTLRRPDNGVTISSTQVTLYALLDDMREPWAEQEIRTWLNLTDVTAERWHRRYKSHGAFCAPRATG